MTSHAGQTVQRWIDTQARLRQFQNRDLFGAGITNYMALTFPSRMERHVQDIH